MNRHTSANSALVNDEGINQRFNLPERQRGPLWKQVDIGDVAGDVVAAVEHGRVGLVGGHYGVPHSFDEVLPCLTLSFALWQSEEPRQLIPRAPRAEAMRGRPRAQQG